MQLELLVKAVA